MNLVIFLSSLVITRAAVLKKNCDGETIKEIFYVREILKEDIDRPYLLAVDYNTNIVYFSYSLNKDDDIFKTAYVNLNNNEFAIVEGILNGFAQTVDQSTHNAYIGGSDGVYRYDHKTKTTTAIGERDIDIWSIFYKDVLYYSTYPSQFLYTLNNDKSERFQDLEDTKVDQIVIDDDNNIFFTNDTGLYSQKKGTKDAKLYKEFPTHGIRGLNLDADGTVYACLQDGIYVVDKTNVELTKLLDIDDAFGVAFDNRNNIIYSDATKLVRLNKDKSC